MEKIDFQQTETAAPKVIKPIRMVDLNNKKHCTVMVEVNFAPGKVISQKEMDDTTFLITWDDGSQGYYKMIDTTRFTLHDCYSCLTLPSHGKDFFDFYHWFKEQHPEVDADTKMAAYYYEKLKSDHEL